MHLLSYITTASVKKGESESPYTECRRRTGFPWDESQCSSPSTYLRLLLRVLKLWCLALMILNNWSESVLFWIVEVSGIVLQNSCKWNLPRKPRLSKTIDKRGNVCEVVDIWMELEMGVWRIWHLYQLHVYVLWQISPSDFALTATSILQDFPLLTYQIGQTS